MPRQCDSTCRSPSDPAAQSVCPYICLMPRHVDWHRVRIGLVVALLLIAAGVVVDSLLSASWALDDGVLLAAAAVIALGLLLIRGRGRSEAS